MTPREVIECPYCGEATQVNHLPQGDAFCSCAAQKPLLQVVPSKLTLPKANLPPRPRLHGNRPGALFARNSEGAE